MKSIMRFAFLALIPAAATPLVGPPAFAQPRPTVTISQPAARIGATAAILGRHGTWSRGPGSYTVTICTEGCDITGAAGSDIPITMEAWAGGGGGGGGNPNHTGKFGSDGGGGGGGGAYVKLVETHRMPGDGVTQSLTIVVGAGGAGGPVSLLHNRGGAGGNTEINGAYNYVGLQGGAPGGQDIGVPRQGGAGGTWLPGSGGTPGLPGSAGAAVTTCNGGGGGAGGASGPGGSVAGVGGAGGHGGYYHSTILPTCTAKGMDNGLTAGSAGANGLVKLTW